MGPATVFIDHKMVSQSEVCKRVLRCVIRVRGSSMAEEQPLPMNVLGVKLTNDIFTPYPSYVSVLFGMNVA